MSTFEIPAAQIVALFMECIFYGIYLVTFFACLRILLWKDGKFKRIPTINKTMVTAALLMLVFGTLDVGLGLRHNLEAFVYTTQTPEEEFARISDWVNVMKFANYSGQTFIGDGILLYRCYVIYNRNFIVVLFPVMMWIGTTVCSALATYNEATLGTGMLNGSQLKPFITTVLTLTLATNIITTGLLVHRIWAIQSRASSRLGPTQNLPYSKVLRVLIECGLIYTTSIVILFACYMAANNALLGVSDSVVQIIGITFNLIILNIDRGTATKPQASSSTIINTRHSESGSRAMPLQHLNTNTRIETTISRYPPDSGIGMGHSKGDIDTYSLDYQKDNQIDQRRERWDV